MSGNPGTQAAAWAQQSGNSSPQLTPERTPVSDDPADDQPRQLDRVTLRGIRGYGHHGVYAFERERGQRFEVDVICWLDLSAASLGDDLAATLDYGELARQVVTDIEGEPVNLVESLALRIARTCLASERTQTAEVTVHKPDAPVQAEVADVAVTLTRSKTRE